MAAVIEALGPSVLRAESMVPLALADVVGGDHAVRVLREAGADVIACGELRGPGEPVADLQLGLAGADMTGVAWLSDNGDSTFDAAIAVVSRSEPAAPATADHVEVAIRKSLYVPDPLQIETGTTVTWVNEDALPHTATATTPDVHFDSDYMALDDRFSYTFDEPGEYPYYCVFHPRMRAVVIVS
jgi:plastocyanin